MKYYFPIHINGGNRGCEGIAKGTAQLLSLPKEQLIGLCSDVRLDEGLHIDDYVTLQKKKRPNLIIRMLNKLYMIVLSFFNVDCYRSSSLMYWYIYAPFIKLMNQGDVMVSTGGDMMCYHENEVIYTTGIAKKLGIKTILWGCSMGKENLTERKFQALQMFDLIYARESLSYVFFKSLGLKNVVCFPDPAFVLKAEKINVPVCFTKGKVIGINLSNYTIGAFNLNTPFGEEVRKLLDYIFMKTDYQILLIPHVLWKEQDDRIISQSVAEEYSRFSDRITMLDSGSLNYQQIRYVISKCKFFIGGRTHAVISAYATCVPTIALGYSIKSLGIAKDLGLSEYVVDTKHITKNSLLNTFKVLDNNAQQIEMHLTSFLPEYIGRTNNIKKIIESI